MCRQDPLHFGSFCEAKVRLPHSLLVLESHPDLLLPVHS